MYKKTTLNNGLTVATHQMPNRVSVSLGIWIKVGARYEQAGISGISHFLEHLLFKGTAKRSCEQIKQSIEGIGGSLNAFTAEELTCYLAKVPAKYTGFALDVLGDMVLNARLAEEHIELERKVILEEIRMYKDLPVHFVMELLSKLLWPKQPLGRNIAGEKETVQRINRARLDNYRNEFYQLDNIAVIACGNLKHSQVVEDCAKAISSSRKTKRSRFLAVRQKQTKAQVKLRLKNTEQTHLALGWHSLAITDPRRYTLGVLHIILGANMSSRLFREVREKRGLAYDIGTSVKFYQDTGAFIVHAGIDNRRAKEALEVILEQLQEIKRSKVPTDELNRAKEYYIGQMSLALEDTFNHMLWLGENLVALNKFLHPQEVIKSVQAIDSDGLKQTANNILKNSNLNLALIGPLQAKDKKWINERFN